MNRKNESTLLSTIKSNLFAVLFFILVAVLVSLGLKDAQETQRTHALQSATDSIRRAVITCYAIEGSYPESFEYIKENYGVYVNEEKFFVHYNAFASNVMPEFRVMGR